QIGAWRTAPFAAAIRRWLALIDETFLETTRQSRRRLLGVIGVITLALSGQQRVQDMMTVVVPLRVEIAGQMARGIVVVFQNQMNLSLRPDRVTHLGGHFIEPIRIVDGVHRIETKSVKAIFDEPIKRIVDEIAADLPL